MQIALDAMGGDFAPGPIVLGAVQAVAADPQVRTAGLSARKDATIRALAGASQ